MVDPAVSIAQSLSQTRRRAETKGSLCIWYSYGTAYTTTPRQTFKRNTHKHYPVNELRKFVFMFMHPNPTLTEDV